MSYFRYFYFLIHEPINIIEPVKISTHHDDEAIRVCTKPFPIDSGLFKFRFSQRMDSELRNSFESSPTSFCGRNQLMNDKFRKSYKQAESFDLHHHNASTKYSSIAEDLLNGKKSLQYLFRAKNSNKWI